MSKRYEQQEDGSWKPAVDEDDVQPQPDYPPMPDMPPPVTNFHGLDLRDRDLANNRISFNMCNQFASDRTHNEMVRTLSDFLRRAWVNGNTVYTRNYDLNERLSQFIGENWKDIGVRVEFNFDPEVDYKTANSDFMKGFARSEPYWKRVLRLSWKLFAIICSIAMVGWLGVMLTMSANALPFSPENAIIVIPTFSAIVSLILGMLIPLFNSGKNGFTGGSGLGQSILQYVEWALILGTVGLAMNLAGITGLLGILAAGVGNFLVLALILKVLRFFDLTNTRHFGTFLFAAQGAASGTMSTFGSQPLAQTILATIACGMVGGIWGSFIGRMAHHVVNRNVKANQGRPKTKENITISQAEHLRFRMIIGFLFLLGCAQFFPLSLFRSLIVVTIYTGLSVLISAAVFYLGKKNLRRRYIYVAPVILGVLVVCGGIYAPDFIRLSTGLLFSSSTVSSLYVSRLLYNRM